MVLLWAFLVASLVPRWWDIPVDIDMLRPAIHRQPCLKLQASPSRTFAACLCLAEDVVSFFCLMMGSQTVLNGV